MNRIARNAGALGLAVAGLGFVLAAQAQTAGSETRRDVDQQQRIERGLQSGQLTTREAAKLEQGEAHVDRVEQRDLRDGSLSARDRAQVQRAQNRESAAIHDQKHDAQTGNPGSASSRRMQADVQRNLDQQRRIHDGFANGSLTNRETSRLEGREAHASHAEARAGADGRIGAREQARIQHADNRDSRRIYRQKHDRQHR
ncbi:MAG: hypothetical protein ABFC67_10465 [Mizugakiibacter sp.]|uniref:hypothetical protein n=1 Tax=Mizugakiibacter sp. TaxID=1972610 RepID=UPI0031C30B75|nr:hypothetical protein [Xanthomonadaceae bacterium]